MFQVKSGFTPALPSDLLSHPLPPGFAVHSDVSDQALTVPDMPWAFR